jgi:hypothetical protein
MSVSPVEVKQCFVLSEMVRDCAGQDPSQFRRCIEEKEQAVRAMREPQLNQRISNVGSRIRASEYVRRKWRFETISIDQTQVFRDAGGLPVDLTGGSVKDVAARVGPSIRVIPQCRAKTAIPGIISMAEIIGSVKLLSVIALPTGDPYRAYSASIRWHLDDGSMRSIGLALSGKIALNAYLASRLP